MTAHEAHATFEIEMRPGEPLLDGTARFDFTKTWSGDLAGTSAGFMASAGDPARGNAGYVALEVVTGTLDGREGSFTLQQFGRMTGGEPALTYAIAPGSGTRELAGIDGEVDLDVVDGVHRAVLRYTLEEAVRAED